MILMSWFRTRTGDGQNVAYAGEELIDADYGMGHYTPAELEAISARESTQHVEIEDRRSPFIGVADPEGACERMLVLMGGSFPVDHHERWDAGLRAMNQVMAEEDVVPY